MMTFEKAMETLLDPRFGRKDLRSETKYLQAIVNQVKKAIAENAVAFVEYWDPSTDSWAVVHPSTYYPGKWRFTRFDKRGWISHYDEYRTKEDALFDAMYDFKHVFADPGALNRVMGESTWEKYLRQNPEDEFAPCHNCGRLGLSIWKDLGEETKNHGQIKAVWQVLRLKCSFCGQDERHARIVRFTDAQGNEIKLENPRSVCVLRNGTDG